MSGGPVLCQVGMKVKVLPHCVIDTSPVHVCLPPVATEKETLLVSIHLRSVEGMDLNHGQSLCPLRTQLQTSTDPITAFYHLGKTNRKMISLFKEDQGSIRVNVLSHNLLAAKESNTPIRLKILSGPKKH